MNAKKDLPFEKAVARLEQILEKMSSGTVALDESMALYEEADGLITLCSKQLQTAEQKIEMLIKKRNGDLQLGGDGRPETIKFNLDE